MLGWAIFRKSVLHVVSNFREAIKIGGGIMLLAHILSVGVIYLATSHFVPQGAYGKNWISFLGSPVAIFLAIIQGLSTFWIAISWHRFLLLNETNPGLLPKWNNSLMFAYFRKSILIAVLLIILAVAIMIPVYILSIMGVLTGYAVGILSGGIIAILVSYVLIRISAVLPAVAIGKPISISAAMDATRPYRSTIVLLAVLSLTVSGIPSYLLDKSSFGTMPQAILTFVVSWAQLMLSISILTTLYGYIFEGRELS